MIFYNREVERFINEFLDELENDNVAVFAGAGLSAPSGYVEWKELMKEFSEDIGLDIEKESDLISLAQYYLNKQRGNRSSITNKLIDEFIKIKEPGENHKILARLPISVYWTTNYDRLIESALIAQNKKPDAKYVNAHFLKSVPKRDAIVYKMHGDVENSHDAVLTKDQYESYYETHAPFLNALAGDLTSRTFMFIGYSFNDPNLEYILARVRVLFKQNQKTHYCFFREVKQRNDETTDDFTYRKIKQHLIVEDLLRFNIHAIMVSEYTDITLILSEIEKRFNRKTVFISGSAHEYGSMKENGKNFIKQLSVTLIRNNFKIVSGFGSGVGQYVIEGALNEIYFNQKEPLADQVQLFPFPKGAELDDLKASYRKNMISHAGAVIFIFGNKMKDGKLIDAPGVLKEFEFAKNNLLIPVGATGYAAKIIWDEIMNNFDSYCSDKSLHPYYQNLGNTELTPEQLIKNILKILTNR